LRASLPVRHNFRKVETFTHSEEDPHHGLILLGTVHTDRLGFAGTERFLLKYEPDLILLELSPFALCFRKEHSRALRKTLLFNLRATAEKLRIDLRTALKNSRIAEIIIQIGLPFEYRASQAYAKRSGVEVIPVDDSEFSKEWISTWPELISSANLENLLQLETASMPVKLQYERAARGIAGEPSSADIWGNKNIAVWQKRENHIAAQISSQLKKHSPARPIYIGGWQHLIFGGRFNTIRDILGLDESSCLLLDRLSAVGQVRS